MTLDTLILLDSALAEFQLSLSHVSEPTPEHWRILNRMDEILRREKAKFLSANPVKRSVDRVDGESMVVANNG